MDSRYSIAYQDKHSQMGSFQINSTKDICPICTAAHGEFQLDVPIDFLDEGIDLRRIGFGLVKLGKCLARCLLSSFKKKPSRRLGEEHATGGEDECSGDLAKNRHLPRPVGVDLR